ncbi:MAG TPA: hypothetical protein VFU62_01365 [Hanamia sp.]|nr:hypothetical protein [Hanamia sp.]
MIKSKGIFAKMQTLSNKNYILSKSKASWALLLGLAFLLLFVSCPVKKFLFRNFNSNYSSVTRSNETNINKSINVGYPIANESCSSAKSSFFKTDLAYPVNIQTPLCFLNNLNASGFKINYYLNGLNDHFHLITANKNLSVPLFLQHLRLLI